MLHILAFPFAGEARQFIQDSGVNLAVMGCPLLKLSNG